jgi:hypothetical protein
MRLSLHFIGIVILLSSQFAWAQPAPPGAPAVVITEIMYHAPSAGEDNLEFIELRNPSDTNERSLSGLFFTQGIEFAFPSGLLLQGHEFVIIAKDSVAFEAFFGVPAFQWTNASLSDIGGTIVLRNGFNQVVDSVKYSSASPWPEEASGNGASIVLCNDTLENAGPSNWTAAATNTGLQVNGIPIFANPNADCSGTNSVRDAELNGLLISPNPSNGQFSLNLPSSFQNKACKLTIADLEGRMLYSDAASQLKEHRFAIDLPNGIYVLSFSDGQHTKHERLVIVR